VNSIFHKFVLNNELLYFAGALMGVVLSVKVIGHLRVKGPILCRSLFYEVWRLWRFKHLRAPLSKLLLLLLRQKANSLATHAVLGVCSRYLARRIRLSAAGEPLTTRDATSLFLRCVAADL
jgi:hypothetical protein